MKPINLVVAMDNQRGIGKKGDLPWRLKGDLAYFRDLTTAASPGKHNIVLMGRKTWDSIPERFRPLPNRYNLVLTQENRDHITVPQVNSWQSFVDYLKQPDIETLIDRVFIIGGATLYQQALRSPLFQIQQIYITQVDTSVDCDVFFPRLDPSWTLGSSSEWQTEDTYHYQFQIWNCLNQSTH